MFITLFFLIIATFLHAPGKIADEVVVSRKKNCLPWRVSSRDHRDFAELFSVVNFLHGYRIFAGQTRSQCLKLARSTAREVQRSWNSGCVVYRGRQIFAMETTRCAPEEDNMYQVYNYDKAVSNLVTLGKCIFLWYPDPDDELNKQTRQTKLKDTV